MKIAIDIRSLTDEYITGVGMYTKQLVEALAIHSPDDELILFASGSTTMLNRVPMFKADNIQTVKLHLPNRLLSLLMLLPGGPTLESFLPHSPDVWIFSKFNLFKTSRPYYLTIHDLAVDIFPQFVTLKERCYQRLVNTHQVTERARGLLAVSQNTATDLCLRVGIPLAKITVTPLGVDHGLYLPREQPSDRTYRAMYDLNRAYILAVATHEPRKNLESVIESYNIYRARGGRQLPLVMVGARGWKTKNLNQTLLASPYRPDIVVLSYVPSKHMPALYRGATCFVFPSFYEGFGLPVLEAMACGLPVISSAISALPEVIGNAGLLVDPFNVNDLAIALHELLDEPHGNALQKHLSALAIIQSASFSWAKTAATTRQALNG